MISLFTNIFLGGNLIFRKSREDQDVIATFTPKKGTAIIFPADLFHEGAVVTSGTKYALRTNIMFECVQSFPEENFKENPEYKEMKALFESFDKLSFEGDVSKFTAGLAASLISISFSIFKSATNSVDK